MKMSSIHDEIVSASEEPAHQDHHVEQGEQASESPTEQSPDHVKPTTDEADQACLLAALPEELVKAVEDGGLLSKTNMSSNNASVSPSLSESLEAEGAPDQVPATEHVKLTADEDEKLSFSDFMQTLPEYLMRPVENGGSRFEKDMWTFEHGLTFDSPLSESPVAEGASEQAHTSKDLEKSGDMSSDGVNSADGTEEGFPTVVLSEALEQTVDPEGGLPCEIKASPNSEIVCGRPSEKGCTDETASQDLPVEEGEGSPEQAQASESATEESTSEEPAHQDHQVEQGEEAPESPTEQSPDHVKPTTDEADQACLLAALPEELVKPVEGGCLLSKTNMSSNNASVSPSLSESLEAAGAPDQVPATEHVKLTADEDEQLSFSDFMPRLPEYLMRSVEDGGSRFEKDMWTFEHGLTFDSPLSESPVAEGASEQAHTSKDLEKSGDMSFDGVNSADGAEEGFPTVVLSEALEQTVVPEGGLPCEIKASPNNEVVCGKPSEKGSTDETASQDLPAEEGEGSPEQAQASESATEESTSEERANQDQQVKQAEEAPATPQASKEPDSLDEVKPAEDGAPKPLLGLAAPEKCEQEVEPEGETDRRLTYEVVEPIFRFTPEIGHFMAADLVKAKETGKMCVRKRLAIEYVVGDTRRTDYEFNNLELLAHENIAELYDIQLGARDHAVLFYMDVVEGPTLKEFVTRQTKLHVDTAREFFAQALDVLEYLHSIHVAHLDVHPDTIVVTADNELKFVDFGFTVPTKKFNWHCRQVMECRFKETMAPEVYEERRTYLAPPADVWSVVILLIFMLEGKFPWSKPHRDCLAFYEWRTFQVCPWSFQHEDAQALIDTTLLDDADYRPEVVDLLMHSFVVNERADVVEEMDVSEEDEEAA